LPIAGDRRGERRERGVLLLLKEPFDRDAAADPAKIVAKQIDDHEMLCPILGTRHLVDRVRCGGAFHRFRRQSVALEAQKQLGRAREQNKVVPDEQRRITDSARRREPLGEALDRAAEAKITGHGEIDLIDLSLPDRGFDRRNCGGVLPLRPTRYQRRQSRWHADQRRLSLRSRLTGLGRRRIVEAEHGKRGRLALCGMYPPERLSVERLRQTDVGVSQLIGEIPGDDRSVVERLLCDC